MVGQGKGNTIRKKAESTTMISTVLVHSFTSINMSMGKRGVQIIEVKTGCGEELSLDYPKKATLTDIGLSGWSNKITCPQCIERNRTKG